MALTGGGAHGGGSARHLLVPWGGRADSVMPKVGGRTCAGLSVAQRWENMDLLELLEPVGVGHRMIVSEGGGALWSWLRGAV